MKIALIGAPGAGKSRLAKKLAVTEPLRDAAIVDNYVQNVEDRYDTACGAAGTWYANLAVAFERYGQERKVAQSEHIITCGTLIESAVYESLNAYSVQTPAAIARARVVIEVVTAMIVDTWRYDEVFYIPLSKTSDKFVSLVNDEIPQALERSGCKHKLITGSDIEGRVEEVLEALSAEV